MTAHAAEFFTMDKVNRLKIIQDVVVQRLTTLMAAQRLGISVSHCQRLLSRYNESGPLGMAGRRRGKPVNNQVPDALARYAFNIIRKRYTDFGPTLPARNTKNCTMFTCPDIGKYIEVWHYPDGRKELRLNGVILPYSTYNRIQEIDQAAIVDNKRLGQIP
ncbi:transposase [Enterobacter hormaechei]|nr:transposase [Enterobacter hormaechei]